MPEPDGLLQCVMTVAAAPWSKQSGVALFIELHAGCFVHSSDSFTPVHFGTVSRANEEC